ncbi:hypothetical protein [Mycobacterium sp. 94-17]|uniref:hypothetical protein n=1 Tax=Mycobacterium sp. 94-17 TaxID=2986147 RepID=UPI002D1ECE40|nr:hypothetical protein [Mycobacterium sp. 94-17]MEB4210040.1 hypothetical protein [Mycobacterium sp. 94-17]
MGGIEHAIDPVRRILERKFSIGALIEFAVWLAIPYLCIGFAWTVFHPDQTQRIQARIEAVSPVGADVAAFGLATALWPAALQIADSCPAP